VIRRNYFTDLFQVSLADNALKRADERKKIFGRRNQRVLRNKKGGQWPPFLFIGLHAD